MVHNEVQDDEDDDDHHHDVEYDHDDGDDICTVWPYIFKWFTTMMIKMMMRMMIIMMMMVNMTMTMVRIFAQFGRISSNGSLNGDAKPFSQNSCFS